METKLSFKLRTLRSASQLTAEDVVKALKKDGFDYTVQSVYKWEKGRAIPDLEILKLLAKIYRCEFSYLIEEENKSYKNLTPTEVFILRMYRYDFLFRSIATQMRIRIQRNYVG